MKKILISDFDKTLFTNAYEENIKAIKKFRQEGNIFVIATGRPLCFLVPDLQELEVDYYICNDGTTIFDKNFNILHSEVIDKEIIIKIKEEFEKNDYLEEWYINEPRKISKNIDGELNGIIGKFNIKSSELVKKINENFEDLYAYNSTKWINVVKRGVSKKFGILKLMELKNFKYEQIITVGDNENDIEMNSYFESYCVKDSKEKLIKVSKHKVNEVYEIIEDKKR